MKFQRPRSGRRLSTIGLLLISGAILSACGDGGGDSTEIAGIGGTGIGVGGTGVVSGKVTGFGSIHVNGGIYNIDSSQFNVDGVNYVGQAGQDELAVGMVVQLNVETINGALTGNALEVVYDDEIEGPISGIVLNGAQKIATIFGQTVTLDETTTIFDGNGSPGFNFATIGVGQVVEVSGFRVSAAEFTATYVRFIENLTLGSTEVELRGTISSYSPGLPETFEIDGITITTDVNTEIEVPNGLGDGLYVEVEGVILTATSVLAEKIEYEDEDFDDDVDDISLQGVVAGFSGIANDFLIDGQLVNASTAQFSPAGSTLANGLDIEVEGEIVGGTLIADKVELREGESKLISSIGTVDVVNNWFEVTYPTLNPGTVIVRVNGQTIFEDETGAVPSETFSIDDLNMNLDFVRVKGQEISNDEVLAIVVKRINPENRLKIEGEVDDYVAGVSITVLGVEYGLDVSTDYDPSPPNIAAGDFVELGDGDNPNPPNGIVDEIKEE